MIQCSECISRRFNCHNSHGYNFSNVEFIVTYLRRLRHEARQSCRSDNLFDEQDYFETRFLSRVKAFLLTVRFSETLSVCHTKHISWNLQASQSCSRPYIYALLMTVLWLSLSQLQNRKFDKQIIDYSPKIFNE